MPGNIGWQGAIIILIVLLVVFGPRRLPEMGRSLGKGMREFKDSISGKDDDEPAHVAQLNAAEAAAGYCSSCGSALPADAQFCAKCGTRVASAASPAAATAADAT